MNETDELKKKLCETIEQLIVNKNVDTFLFGSKSAFNDLCLRAVTYLKEKYPYIKRIYVRAEFPYIDDNYKDYLSAHYEDSYYPMQIINSGKYAYIERNYEMIDSSDYCVLYYDENYTPQKRNNRKTDLSVWRSKSGTKLAYDYAVKKGTKIKIINIYKELIH